jgi:hypothetical protein
VDATDWIRRGHLDPANPLFADITKLARRSGFRGVVDLLKSPKHGCGENVYSTEFRYDAERKTEQT